MACTPEKQKRIYSAKRKIERKKIIFLFPMYVYEKKATVNKLSIDNTNNNNVNARPKDSMCILKK